MALFLSSLYISRLENRAPQLFLRSESGLKSPSWAVIADAVNTGAAGRTSPEEWEFGHFPPKGSREPNGQSPVATLGKGVQEEARCSSPSHQPGCSSLARLRAGAPLWS